MRAGIKYAIVGAAGVLLAVGVGVFSSTATAANYDAYYQEKLSQSEADGDAVESKLAAAKDDLADARAASLPARELARRESQVAQDEIMVTNREAAAKQRESEVSARETAVQGREDAIANVGAEPWIAQVRECLARSGDYVSASVDHSSYSGLDFSCYTG